MLGVLHSLMLGRKAFRVKQMLVSERVLTYIYQLAVASDACRPYIYPSASQHVGTSLVLNVIQ